MTAEQLIDKLNSVGSEAWRVAVEYAVHAAILNLILCGLAMLASGTAYVWAVKYINSLGCDEESRPLHMLVQEMVGIVLLFFILLAGDCIRSAILTLLTPEWTALSNIVSLAK